MPLALSVAPQAIAMQEGFSLKSEDGRVLLYDDKHVRAGKRVREQCPVESVKGGLV